MKIFIDDIGKCGLVYETIQVGFPEGEVVKIDGRYSSHHDTIRLLISTEQEPFWIVDTDVIFFEQMLEHEVGNAAFFGEYQPPFECPVTGYYTVARLNPACMWIDPIRFRSQWNDKVKSSPVPHYAPLAHPVAPIVVGNEFFDVMAQAYHNIESRQMTGLYRDCFVHLHCGSWLDVASQHIPGLADIHARAKSDPQSLRNLREIQHEFYRTHAPQQ